MNKKGSVEVQYGKTIWAGILIGLLLSINSCHSPVKNDKSFTPDKYKELGMPDYNVIWKEPDFAKAIAVLYDIVTRYPDALPRYKSKKSGVYFDRITNIDNLYFLQNPDSPLSEKAYHIQIYEGMQGELVKIYTNILTKKQYYHKEIIRLHEYGLKIFHEMLDLGYQIKNSGNPQDRKMDQQGFDIVVNQYAKYVGNLLKLINNSEAYSPEDRSDLSQFITVSLTANHTMITPAAKDQIKRNLLETKQKVRTGTIKKNLEKAINALQ